MTNVLIEKILGAADRLGLKQRDVERYAGLAPGRITRWKKNGEPSGYETLRLARVLKVPIEYLADNDLPVQDPPPSPASEGSGLALLTFVRALRLSEEEAIRRITLSVTDGGAGLAGRENGITIPVQAAPPPPSKPRVARADRRQAGKSDAGA